MMSLINASTICIAFLCLISICLAFDSSEIRMIEEECKIIKNARYLLKDSNCFR